jgi:hypothetical protein
MQVLRAVLGLISGKAMTLGDGSIYSLNHSCLIKMKEAGFYAHLKSSTMIENSKFYFYILGAINNSVSLVNTLDYYST